MKKRLYRALITGAFGIFLFANSTTIVAKEIPVEERVIETVSESIDISESIIEEPVINYIDYKLPLNSGFKSYMSYTSITDFNSRQYMMQLQAHTGEYGIRQVDDRYCIAVGSYFATEIGTYLDVVLSNGTVIPCILADQKADIHTDENHILTKHNGCATEFVVDMSELDPMVKIIGDISLVDSSWYGPIDYIRVYIQ